MDFNSYSFITIEQTRKGWATFDDEQVSAPAPPPPPMATHPEFNKPGPGQTKKPPPLPKPYAETKNKGKKPQGLQMGECCPSLTFD